ncbi:MAG: sigma-70 family RNA polymerase sigma factor [Acutalibacteraceae bacterium]
MKGTVDYSELINAAKNGDGSAFDELYKLTVKASYCTASILLSNSCDVEDVLQNAYLKAFQKLPELKNPESFEGWMKTIVENECKNYIKREKRINAPIIFLKNRDEEHSEEWDQPIPQEYIEREELRKSVSDILNNLSPEVRACIVLYHFDDKSLDEIKDILDIPLGTVKSRLHHGRKEIEKEFGKLRKKDPTLYGVGAIPAVLSLLAFRAKNIVVPAAIADASVSASVSAVSSAASGAVVASGTAAASCSAAASGTAAVSAGAGSAAASTVGAASTAAVSIGVKIAAVAVAGSVAVGGTVAIKEHIDSKPPEDMTSYATTAGYEETHTVEQAIAELTTEISTTASTTASTTKLTTAKTTAALSQMITAAQTTAARTKKPVSTKRSTTSPQTTVTTAKQTTTTATTAKVTTTAKATTTAAKTTVTEKETTARQQTTNPENNFGASGGVITEYKGNDSSVSIPSSVGSTPVTAIGSGAFSGNTSIKSVSIPSSVTQIGQEAFADCASLSSVSLPSSLEVIGIGAFYGCSSLTSVTIPDGTKSIGDEAFAQCTSLQSVTIPESVTIIAADAFDGCDSVTIRCKEGSVAHEFAVANSIKYSLI